MKTRFIKITLTLTMLLVMTVPTQAFAAEKSNTQLNLTKNSNCSTLYNQFKDQLSKAGITNLTAQQANQPTQTKQTPVTSPTTPVAPAKPTTPATPSTLAKQTTPSGSATLNNYEQQVVDLVNKERAAAGLSALTVNTTLAKVAETKAADLRDNNYFDHQSPKYGSPFDMMHQFGITYSNAGENIAKGQRTPEEVMNGWMNSPGHRANILNANYTQIGVGYVTDSNGTGYWVQEFIRP